MKEVLNRSKNRPDTLDSERKAAVQKQLELILHSPQFRNSRRSQSFLSYIVEHSLKGESDLMKERLIGIEVFDRSPSYNTGEDSVVRVTAAEVRKKLAQYYIENDHTTPLRIDLPPGHYVPKFCWHEQKSLPPDPDQNTQRVPLGIRSRSTKLLVSILAILALVVGVSLFRRRTTQRTSSVSQFWSPLLRSRSPVLIGLGQFPVYQLSPRLYSKYTGNGLPTGNNGKPKDIRFSPNDIIHGRDLFLADGVGSGDATAACNIAALLGSFGNLTEIRIGPMFTAEDLHNSPAVLIGSYTNRLITEATTGLHFSFAYENGHLVIKETVPPHRVWYNPGMGSDGLLKGDYGLISRIFDSKTGRFLVFVAGITNIGTRAAGEFVTNDGYIKKGLKDAPPNWENKNIQFVIYVNVLGGVPSPPVIVASYYW